MVVSACGAGAGAGQTEKASTEQAAASQAEKQLAAAVLEDGNVAVKAVIDISDGYSVELAQMQKLS